MRDYQLQIHEEIQAVRNFTENRRPSFFLKAYFSMCLGVVFFVTALLCAADCQAANVTLPGIQALILSPAIKYSMVSRAS